MEKTFLQRQWVTVRRQLMPVLVMVALMWLAELPDLVLPKAWSLDRWGIHPREVTSLPGVALAPFLHKGFIHLLENTVPLLVLGWLVVVSGRWLFFRVALVTGLSSGLGAWALGQSGSLHIGASGIVFGLLGFLIARGWVARRVGWTLMSMVVGVVYFGTVLGLLGPKPEVSWSSHFWGFMGGIGFAWWLYRHEGVRYLSGTGKKSKVLEQGSSGLAERIAGMGMDLVKGKDLKSGTKGSSGKEPR